MQFRPSNNENFQGFTFFCFFVKLQMRFSNIFEDFEYSWKYTMNTMSFYSWKCYSDVIVNPIGNRFTVWFPCLSLWSYSTSICEFDSLENVSFIRSRTSSRPVTLLIMIIVIIVPMSGLRLNFKYRFAVNPFCPKFLF